MKINRIHIAALAFVITFVLKGQLPDSGSILPELADEPDQTETTASPFDITKSNITYTLTPKFEYELYGLVVSDHNTQGKLEYYHNSWKDKLNIKDLCIVWGDNLKENIHKGIKYKNGSWTCYWSTKSQAAWDRFNKAQISNNHILVEDKKLARMLRRVKPGDQIHLKGKLVSYAHGENFKRETSITRTDRGCETIYLEQLDILKKSHVFWRWLNVAASIFLLAVLLQWAYAFCRKPHQFDKST